MKIDLENPREIDKAAMRLGKSCFDALCKKHDIAPGGHKLGNHQLILTFPEVAGVSRAAGSNGDGTSNGDIPKLELTPNAVLLLLARAGIHCSEYLWAEVIRDDLKGQKGELPPDALIGLAVVQGEVDKLAPTEPPKIKTPTQSTGQKEIALELKKMAQVKPAKR